MHESKLYLAAIATVIVGGAAIAWWYVRNENETVPIMAPLVEANDDTAASAAEAMTPSERQSAIELYMSPRPYFSPNAYDQGADEDISLFPAGYKRLLSIPFHGNKRVLRVYAAVNCSLSIKVSADCISNEVIVVMFDPEARVSRKVATIIGFQAANYGGIYVPLALSADDKTIILRAWMGSPGAGGSQVDLGYAAISALTTNASYHTEDLPALCSHLAVFYDSYGKIISLEESEKLFDWQQPGRRPNQGAIVFRDMTSGETKILADGEDTSYEIRYFDEASRSLGIQRIRYGFGPDCPRAEKSLDCAAITATNLAIRVP